MKYHIIVLSCLLWIKLTECFQWDNSVSDSSVYANNSGSAIIKFRYSYGAEDRSSVNITCGIWNTDQTKIIPMVTKIGNQPAQRRSGVTGDVLGNNAALYTESTQPTVIGLRLSNIAKTFPTQYRCDASFTKADGVADSVLSERVILNVLERPKFTNCLQNIQSKETVAGNSLDITCKVSGNPTPNLKCSLLAFDREILNTFPKKNSGRNLEEDEPGMPSNITASFSNLPKEARFVRCFASQTFTGTNTLERRFTILHTPFPPKNFRQENSPDRTSITVSWLPLTDDEWGGAKDGYMLAYYMSGQDPRLNLTTKELGRQPSEFGQDANVYVSRKVGEKEFYFYTIKGLNPQRPYQVWLYAQNRYGKGDDSMRFSMTPGDNPISSANNTTANNTTAHNTTAHTTTNAPSTNNTTAANNTTAHTTTNNTIFVNATVTTGTTTTTTLCDDTDSGSIVLYNDIRCMIICNLVLLLMFYHSS